MKLAIAGLAFVVLSGALVKRPHYLIFAILLAWSLAPSVANEYLLGAAIHPGALFTFAVLAFLLPTRSRWLATGLERNPVLVPALALLALLSATITYFNIGLSPVLVYLGTYGAGFVLLLLIRSVVVSVPGSLQKIVRGVVLIAVAQSLVAVLQLATGDVLLWGTDRLKFYWFNPEQFRPMGTMDSTLDLAMLAVIALPLCTQIRTAKWQILSAGVLVAGILATQSRTGVVFAVVGVAYLLARSNMSVGARMFSIASTAAGALLVFFVPNDLTAGVRRRFSESTGSTTARESALEAFWGSIERSGGGFGSAGWFRSSGATETSLENGFLMYIYDFGIPVAALLFAIIVGVLCTGMGMGMGRGKALPGTVASAAFAATFAAAFSGIATQSAAAVLLFTALAMAIPMSRVHAEQAPPSSADRNIRAEKGMAERL